MARGEDSVDTFQPGDREAFAAMYARVAPSIRSFLRHYLDDHRAADDVLQDVFLELWKKPDGFNPSRGTLRQYLFGIARHRATDWRRAHPRAESARAGVPTIDDGTHAVEVRGALRQLDRDDRTLLWLREVEGYSYSELADLLGVPLGTVKSRLFTARAAFRRVWRRERPVAEGMR